MTVIILLIVLLAGRGETPVVSPTETPAASSTPSPSQTAPVPKPSPSATTEAPASPTFDSFSAPATATCEEGATEAPLTFVWSSGNAVRAYLGTATTNAALNPTVSDLPATDTYSDLQYDCSLASQVYTVTLEDASGGLASQTVTITKQ